MAAIAWSLALSIGLVFAATERTVEYQYDAAGNVVRIITLEQSDPPLISSVSPDFINQGQTRTIEVTGSSLLGVAVVTDAPGLAVSGVESTESALTFQLTAAATAPVGEANLRFQTGLGVTVGSIFVAEAVPGLNSNPDPITVDLSGTPRSVSLIFSQPRPEDETYELSTGDSNIATPGSGSFTILEGETQAVVSLTGLSTGATDIRIVQPEKFYAYSFPVFVGESYQDLLARFPELQSRNLFAKPVGVSVGSRTGPFASPVGVRFGDDLEGQLFAKPVGVLFADSLASPVLATPVGVTVGDTIGYAYTAPVEVIYGPIVDSSEPTTVTVDSTVDFTLQGFNLDEVLTVTVNPPNDVLVGAVSANAAATELTIGISIDITAAAGPRQLVLQGVSGPVIVRSGATLSFEIQ